VAPLANGPPPAARSAARPGNASSQNLPISEEISMSPIRRLATGLESSWTRLVRALESLQPLALLLARCYVAKVFFLSGLTKLRDWDSTLALFHDIYYVPLLPPDVAAVMGTAGETILPVMLVLGFGGRFAALGLFIQNLVAANSLELAPAALQQHWFWGCLIAGLAIWGPGPWALESVWPRRLNPAGATVSG
jgi:putative oxidoreductase